MPFLPTSRHHRTIPIDIQPWEFGALPLQWIEPLRDRVDEIWCPSSYVKRVYERSGVPGEKLHVIPWGIDPAVFHPGVPRLLLPTQAQFIFLFVGGTIARKGFDLLLEAYLREFTRNDRVCLIIKDMGANTFYRYGNYRQQILHAMAQADAPELIYLDEQMTEGQLASLYTACDCLVAPYRGEGFGLPVLEAMACGLPPIVPRGGATDDFVTDDLGYLLPSSEVECEHGWRLCAPATELSIKLEDLRQAMRHAVHQRSKTRRMGRSASRFVRRRFTWARTIQSMLKRLKQLQQLRSQRLGTDAEKMHCDDTQELPLLAASHAKDSPLRGLMRHARPPAGNSSLSVCMLARDNEQTIADNLARIRPFAEELIILDLQSSDRTAAVAQEYGARVYQASFSGGFAELRNAMLLRATGRWILSLDANELLSEDDAHALRSLINELPDDVFGVRLRLLNLDTSDLDNHSLRLFRNHNDVHYVFRACEDVAPSICRLGKGIVHADITIRCLAPPNLVMPLNGRSPAIVELLHQDLVEHNSPVIRFRLGSVHYRLGNYFHAECYFADCLAQVDPADNLHRRAVDLLIDCHRRKGDLHRAQEIVEAAMQHYPGDTVLRHQLAQLAAGLELNS